VNVDPLLIVLVSASPPTKSLRRIRRLGVRRETVSAYLKVADVDATAPSARASATMT
jgi:hypothetical protein